MKVKATDFTIVVAHETQGVFMAEMASQTC